ncbi:hypothetical protein [Cupriavidus sp. D39]|uniref:hypothetical protein n=1 Tax=Cupriavidus sp. D39 TaxID=2997877 RepID=UPI003B63715F
MAFNDSAAWFGRRSCTKRISFDRITIVPITMVAFKSSVTYEIAASTVSSRLKGFR